MHWGGVAWRVLACSYCRGGGSSRGVGDLLILAIGSCSSHGVRRTQRAELNFVGASDADSCAIDLIPSVEKTRVRAVRIQSIVCAEKKTDW
jgi:hypothetical protein